MISQKHKTLSKYFNFEQLAKDLLNKRLAKKYTLAQAETASRINKATLCRLELNKTVPDLQTYINLCKWLNKPLETYFLSIKIKLS